MELYDLLCAVSFCSLCSVSFESSVLILQRSFLLISFGLTPPDPFLFHV